MNLIYVTNYEADDPSEYIHVVGICNDPVVGIKKAFEYVLKTDWIRMLAPDEEKYITEIREETNQKKLLELVNDFCDAFREDFMYSSYQVHVKPVEIMDK